MKYFVTGAIGFLGAKVVRQLISKEHHVYAIIRDPGKASELKMTGVQLFKGDVKNYEYC
jgi:uncharacterized protein YbjT (DUF2867 family)